MFAAVPGRQGTGLISPRIAEGLCNSPSLLVSAFVGFTGLLTAKDAQRVMMAQINLKRKLGALICEMEKE